ncbi:hypothetical protein AC1031_021622 [Aphanomyces cochlioides]|nr:hypothetical protein AC1031_021622 [Aphanomyces cochlioides]
MLTYPGCAENQCDGCGITAHAAENESMQLTKDRNAPEKLTSTVDDELGVQLGSIIEVATRDGTQKRRNAAYKHLSYFVQKYCGSVRAENWKDISLIDMTESLIAVRYLFGSLCNSRNESWCAVDIVQCCRHDFEPGISSMKSVFTIRNISAGLPMMTPHAAASADDLIALSKVCFCAGDENAANAILFLQSLVQCVGRGSEVAMIKHEDIRLTTIQETQEWNMLKISCGVRKPGTVYYVTYCTLS